MNATSLDIKAMLDADTDIDLSGYLIERGTLRADISNTIAIIDVPGGPSQLTMDKKQYNFESIQIKVQSEDYDEGWAKANDIKNSLHGRAHETWNGTYYSVITCINGPGFYERVNQRTIFVINFNVQRR